MSWQPPVPRFPPPAAFVALLRGCRRAVSRVLPSLSACSASWPLAWLRARFVSSVWLAHAVCSALCAPPPLLAAAASCPSCLGTPAALCRLRRPLHVPPEQRVWHVQPVGRLLAMPRSKRKARPGSTPAPQSQARCPLPAGPLLFPRFFPVPAGWGPLHPLPDPRGAQCGGRLVYWPGLGRPGSAPDLVATSPISSLELDPALSSPRGYLSSCYRG